MKRLSKRITVITNLILVVALIAVYAISFVPQTAVPIYGGDKIEAIYRGNVLNKNVSLMFNVYENTDTVNKIIDILNEKNVKATFFVGGCWADDNGQTLCRIVECGHEIANHGYFHKDHKKLDYDANEKEISLTGVIIKALCGVQPTLFAPPSGSFSETTLSVANSLNYKVIMWSKDTIDWRDKDVDLIVKRATKNPANGDLILMHPKTHTVKALPKIIDFYVEMGYRLVTVSENIS